MRIVEICHEPLKRTTKIRQQKETLPCDFDAKLNMRV